MYNTLLKLEKAFFKIDNITNEKWLSSILHDNFKELGCSGVVYYKQDVIDAFSSFNSSREIVIYNFEYLQINSNCWMVHYITKKKGEMFYRTSIWLKEDALKIIFHQASKLHHTCILKES